MKDSLWRSVLCWGTVITFLTMPLVVLTLAITSRLYGWLELTEHLKGYKFLGNFYQSITALVFGLSGLRSLDKYVETKNGKNPNDK